MESRIITAEYQQATELHGRIMANAEIVAGSLLEMCQGLKEMRDKKLYQKYAYENDNYIIRPAKGKQELFVEGTVLSHCVYTNYSDKYLNGKVLILLVREKDNPDTPFYTLELNPKNNNVVQCRTFRNGSYLEDKDLTALMKEYQQFLALPLREKKKLKIKVA